MKYLVIGGMAMVFHGFNRGTEGIDLLVDKVASNISLLKKALSILPDNAVEEVINSNIEEYGVVRVADEVVVDLMGRHAESISNLQKVKLSGMNLRE